MQLHYEYTIIEPGNDVLVHGAPNIIHKAANKQLILTDEIDIQRVNVFRRGMVLI